MWWPSCVVRGTRSVFQMAGCLHGRKVELPLYSSLSIHSIHVFLSTKLPLVSLRRTFWSLVNKAWPSGLDCKMCFNGIQYTVFIYICVCVHCISIILYMIYISMYSCHFKIFHFHQIPMARHLFTCHGIIPNRAHGANTSTGAVDPIITSPFLRMLEHSHWGNKYFATHILTGNTKWGIIWFE